MPDHWNTHTHACVRAHMHAHAHTPTPPPRQLSKDPYPETLGSQAGPSGGRLSSPPRLLQALRTPARPTMVMASTTSGKVPATVPTHPPTLSSTGMSQVGRAGLDEAKKPLSETSFTHFSGLLVRGGERMALCIRLGWGCPSLPTTCGSRKWEAGGKQKATSSA